MQQQTATVAGFTIGKDCATVLHAGQCVYRGSHYLVARFAFYVGDQAETTVIPLKGFVVQHISEPPQALRTPSDTDCAQAQKEHGDGVCTSHSPSLNPFRIGTQV
ncbi:conserved hypothetical protein [Klebsiella quasipneumoniae subsp. similipneumoniae]|nr:conserved hypothetical protein [Klebsiella quasipneumoniae subsp. similipneumoniae]CTP99669.1 conserved hypothetical protein [Klebsiella variicola]SAY85880.1 conserved hypothetical protein [Klebsiella quasipneumoniae subsp. similipneumoniae]SBN29364.1 conserved hypothetical protein [Klebsiella variicola]